MDLERGRAVLLCLVFAFVLLNRALTQRSFGLAPSLLEHPVAAGRHPPRVRRLSATVTSHSFTSAFAQCFIPVVACLTFAVGKAHSKSSCVAQPGLCRAWRRRPAKATSYASVGQSAAAVADDKSVARKVVLVGDSVLDNFFWLQTPKQHLRVQLQELLQASKKPDVRTLRCVNLAVDQMTTFDFQERTQAGNPWTVYANARRCVDFVDEQDQEYTVSEDGKIRSAKALASLKEVSWVVLSIGGNDVYLNKEVQSSLVFSLLPSQASRRQEVAEAFGQRLRAVVSSIKKAAPNAGLVIVVPYQPHRDFSLLMGAPIDDEGKRIQGDLLGDFIRGLEWQYLPDLVTPLVLEYFKVAKEFGCAVIDLSKTLDPSCEEHYGTGRIGRVNDLGAPWSGAEPSDISSGFIAQLIVHALERPTEAMVYRGVPRQEGADKWSCLVKEDANDFVFIEDYQFGRSGSGRRAAAASDDGSGTFWFGIGVALTVLVNVATVLQGGDALFFDRAEFESELKAQISTQDPAPGAKSEA